MHKYKHTQTFYVYALFRQQGFSKSSLLMYPYCLILLWMLFFPPPYCPPVFNITILSFVLDDIQPSTSHPLNPSLHLPLPFFPDASSPWRWSTGSAPRGMTGITTVRRGTMRVMDTPMMWIKTSVSRWDVKKERWTYQKTIIKFVLQVMQSLIRWIKFDQSWSSDVTTSYFKHFTFCSFSVLYISLLFTSIFKYIISFFISFKQSALVVFLTFVMYARYWCRASSSPFCLALKTERRRRKQICIVFGATTF